MTVAKIAPYNFGKVKKKVKKYVRKFFGATSGVPGQMDYPAIPKVLEMQKRRSKLFGVNATKVGR